MSLFEIGRLCLKIAGRDAGMKCIVLQKIDEQYVLVDGQTRRKKINIKHLEPLSTVVEVQENASNAEVKSSLKKLGIEIVERKSKSLMNRPARKRKIKVTLEKTEKAVKTEKKQVVKDSVNEKPKKSLSKNKN